MRVGTTNTRELYFEYQDITRVNRESMFATLHSMGLQLKVNTIPIPCTLDRGVERLIGIISSPVMYTTIALMSPFTIPAHQELLNIAKNATQYQIAHARAHHESATHTSRTYKLVQRTMIHKHWKLLKLKC